MKRSDRPHIGLVAPSAYPLGGVAVWIEYLVAGLLARRYSVSVGLTSGSHHDVSRYCLNYPNLPVVPIENPTGSAEGRRRAIAGYIEEQRPDLVLGVNVADLYPAVRRLRARGRTDARVAMTLHAIEADLLADCRASTDVLDGVVASNRLACRLCATNAGLPEDRILYAPYGVDVRGLSTRVRRSEPGRRLEIAWAGRLEEPQKHVSHLVPILRALDARQADYKLRIAGDGPDRDQLLASLAPWTTQGKVEWLGALPATAMGEEIYSRSDILLLTSSWETGPIVVWEAMAAGVCVISSRYVGSGLEGSLHSGENCLMFDVGDSEAAAAQIMSAADCVTRERLVAAASKLVTQRYSRERSVDAWAVAIEKLMSRAPASVAAERACTPSGRLDRWFGVERAESVRRMLRVSYPHRDPGGEWPHTHSAHVDSQKLLLEAKRLDR